MQKEESDIMQQQIKAAYQEWEDAKSYFEYINDPELMDWAIFSIEAAKRRFLYMLKQMKSRVSG